MSRSGMPATLTEAVDQLSRGDVSSVELTQAYLERIDRVDGQTGAFVTRFDDEALLAAAAADRSRASGARGALLGVPIALKDIIATREAETWSNSEVHRPEWGRRRDAHVTVRLRAAGAVILGKLTTNEYALGGPDPAKRFPVPHNPWNLGRTAGGSSSGSGVAVAAGLCAAALGTDTGGSVRLPCAFNGVTGLLPTLGRVPTDGVVPLAWSMDRVGAMARSVADCGTLASVLTGADLNGDAHTGPASKGSDQQSLAGLRIGLVREPLATPGSDPAASTALDGAAAALTALGARVSTVRLPHYQQTVAAAVLTLFGEGFDAHRDLLATHWDRYGWDTRIALVRGAFVSSADYVRAQRVRTLAQRELAGVFEEVDLLLMPTATIGAPERAGFIETGVLPHIHTFYWNAVGHPVLAVPAGFTAEQLPLGLQFVGAPFGEERLLTVGRAFQSVTDHHRAEPELVEATELT